MFKKLFVSSLLFFFFFTAYGKGDDSLGIVKKDDKYFILHKVSSGETLSGLAKRYQVKIDDLIKTNDGTIKKDQIKIGQVLYIPTKNIILPPTANSSVKLPIKKAQGRSNLKAKFHLIKDNESLYKIAFMYNIHVDSLKKWNHLEDNQIKTNEKLIVGYTSSSNEPYIPNSGANITHETGMGQMITGAKTELKLALHRKLPIGSYIRVFNESSGASVTVRVIGKIPNIDADEKVIIKLSQAACKSLGVVNERFPVTLAYEKTKK
jgi:LysM repeat protein